MNAPSQYLVTITRESLQVVCQGEERAIIAKTGPKLLPEDKVVINTCEMSLDDLSQALIEYDEDWLTEFLDERGQLEVGQYLYQEIFGRITPYDLTEEGTGIELRIITRDENIARLPWVLLAYNAVFLSTMGWAISLTTAPGTVFCELPPRPKILAVVPQPKELEATNADEHLQELKELLTAADLAYGDAERFRVVADLSSFYAELEVLQPDILYYYGHGIGNEQTTRLLFADQQGRTVKTPLPDIAAALQNLPEHGRPKLAYINCCQGDSGGLLGVGRQLLPHIPAVVTNRTTAFINAARPQALAFWEALLLKGEAPHTALIASHARLGGLGLTTADIRWMTPVLHCRYEDWKATPPVAPDRSKRDPHWDLKVDRKRQYSLVSYQIRTMMREQKVRGYAFLWYGHPDQGLNIFHRRLEVELREELEGLDVCPFCPRWPDEMENPRRSLEEMMCRAFDVPALAHIAGRIRTCGSSSAGTPVLVYICHKPLEDPMHFHPKYISTYLKWWGNEFLSHLPENAFALLGFSYETTQPKNFRKALYKALRPDQLDLSRQAVFEILDELSAVEKEDLLRFIQTHRIHVPADLIDKVLEDILHATEGKYFRVLEELRCLENRCYREEVEASLSKTDSGDDPWENAF